MDGIELPKLTKRALRIVEKDGAGKLLARARQTRLYPLILLDLATGARRGELLALQWSDINFENRHHGVVEVARTDEKRRPSGELNEVGEAPAIRGSAAALDALREHRIEQDRDREMFGADYQENNLVFCRPEGGYYSPDRAGAE